MQTNTRSNAPSAGQNLEENNPGNEPQKRFLPQRNPQPPPQEGWRRGDPTRQSPVEPIKALAFNTLLSSQETDSHRAETRSHGPRPRVDSLFTLPEPLGMSISSFSGSAVPMPLARRLPGGEAISSDPARLSKSAFSDAADRRTRRNRVCSVDGGFPTGRPPSGVPLPCGAERTLCPRGRNVKPTHAVFHASPAPLPKAHRPPGDLPARSRYAVSSSGRDGRRRRRRPRRRPAGRPPL